MPENVDIWYTFPGAIRNPELLAGYKEILSADEMKRFARFWFDRDRHLHLVAWALVRTTLSRYADIAPEVWQFRTNRWGRPEIAGPEGLPPLRFNLSHTRGLVACIVAEGIDVGVDVEDRRRETHGPDIARRYFSAREVEAFESLPAEQQATTFFEYWTLKEAYIKAVGVGISLGLGRFSFALDERGVPVGDPERWPPVISFDATLDDDPDAWQFAQFEPTPHHAMAAAIHRGDGPDRRINLYEVVPGLDPE
jgi:4'-phosphopantetheinyl transferase